MVICTPELVVVRVLPLKVAYSRLPQVTLVRICILIPPVAILPDTPVASSRSQIHKSITLAILWRASAHVPTPS